MRTNGISPVLTARLAPGEEILLHHRPDPQVYRFWRRFFLWMAGGMVAVGLGAVLVAAAGISPPVKALFCLGVLGLVSAFVLLLGVEGRKLDRHAAIVTQRRIPWANGGELRICHRSVRYRLFYPADKAASPEGGADA